MTMLYGLTWLERSTEIARISCILWCIPWDRTQDLSHGNLRIPLPRLFLLSVHILRYNVTIAIILRKWNMGGTGTSIQDIHLMLSAFVPFSASSSHLNGSFRLDHTFNPWLLRWKVKNPYMVKVLLLFSDCLKQNADHR